MMTDVAKVSITVGRKQVVAVFAVFCLVGSFVFKPLDVFLIVLKPTTSESNQLQQEDEQQTLLRYLRMNSPGIMDVLDPKSVEQKTRMTSTMHASPHHHNDGIPARSSNFQPPTSGNSHFDIISRNERLFRPSDPLCVTPELDGGWVSTRTITTTSQSVTSRSDSLRGTNTTSNVPSPFLAAPKVCPWDEEVYPNPDKPECGPPIRNQHWYCGRSEGLMHMGGYCGQCHGFVEEFQWQFNSGPLQQGAAWNGLQTCQRLGTRSVLMIGDSTMQQACTTLMNGVYPHCQHHFCCALSDGLIADNVTAWGERGATWMAALDLYLLSRPPPDIVILTAGAHIHEEAKYVHLVKTVIQQIHEVRERFPPMEIYWKTQSPGGCVEKGWTPPRHHSPLLVGRDHDWNNPARRCQLGNVYQWPEFFGRDQWTIRQMMSNNIPVLDMRMLYARMEGHPYAWNTKIRDGLHYCAPGPIDVFARVFDRVVLQQAEKRTTCVGEVPGQLYQKVFEEV